MLVISRKDGGGIEFSVKPSDKQTHINLKVLEVFENDFGTLEVKIGIIASQEVRISRHEAMIPEAFVIDSVLTEKDKSYLKEWASVAGRKVRD